MAFRDGGGFSGARGGEIVTKPLFELRLLLTALQVHAFSIGKLLCLGFN